MAHTTSAPTYAEVKRDSCPRSNLRSHLRLLSGGRRTSCARASSSECDPERPCGLRAASRVLPPALLHRLIVLAGARTRIARLGVPIALEKEAEAVVAPVVAARNGDIDRRPAHHEAALGLVVQHRDELGAIGGLTAQRLARANVLGSLQCHLRDTVWHILGRGDVDER